MKRPQIISAFITVALLFSHAACNQPVKPSSKIIPASENAQVVDYLLKVCDSNNTCGYAESKGDMIIAAGKYEHCFTDTFRIYAIVVIKNSFLPIAIDRRENILYQVFNYDNGPDEPVDGLFRIVIDKKIGYADAATGNIVITPQFDCAFAFENGVAQVSNNCKTKAQGEHSEWLSDDWFYIDTTGKKMNIPE